MLKKGTSPCQVYLKRPGDYSYKIQELPKCGRNIVLLKIFISVRRIYQCPNMIQKAWVDFPSCFILRKITPHNME
jgi:hypothetical protein